MRSCRTRPRGNGACGRSIGPPRTRRQRQAQLEERFAELGATAVSSWRACSERSVTARTRRNGCWRSWGSYARQDLIAALERAVRYGAYSHAAVERILSVQARPKSVLETLAEDQRRHLAPVAGRGAGVAPAHVGLPTPRRPGAARP